VSRVASPLILCYHAVADDWDSDLAVTTAQLREQLEYFAARGYVGATFSQSEEQRVAGDGGRRVVVTFDDGFRSVLRARPILDSIGFPGTVFVVSRYVSTGQPFGWHGVAQWLESPLGRELESLTWEECRDLRESGWEIGSHTLTHPLLPLLDDARCRDELEQSRREVAAHLGSCETLAYPYGQATAAVAAAARTAGYRAACTLRFARQGEGPFLRSRIGIVRSDTLRRVALKAHPMVSVVRATPLARLAERMRMVGSSRQSFDQVAA